MTEMKSFHSMKAKLMKEERQPNNASIKQSTLKHNSLSFQCKFFKMRSNISLPQPNAMPRCNPKRKKKIHFLSLRCTNSIFSFHFDAAMQTNAMIKGENGIQNN